MKEDILYHEIECILINDFYVPVVIKRVDGSICKLDIFVYYERNKFKPDNEWYMGSIFVQLPKAVKLIEELYNLDRHILVKKEWNFKSGDLFALEEEIGIDPFRYGNAERSIINYWKLVNTGLDIL